ncbi:hypothetical protein CANARDRAFT_5015 [[Candida] arabinofermentans NRRL YB-2248]|uniref:Uncharacterized protein n=1 Tax=[Candida] arabinofermentans NRRL YB-2248 TaxID=983967 RepID=A0A1E4T7R9_9ASCO|nr:hypothetical protein CANARDRAFT_5015 [[Candida] arabinofermentans NRRL YB-2248]
MNTTLTEPTAPLNIAKVHHKNSLDNSESTQTLLETDSEAFTGFSNTKTAEKAKSKNPFRLIHRRIKRHIEKAQNEKQEVGKAYYINLLNCEHELHPYFRELFSFIAYDDYEMNDDIVDEYYKEVENGTFRGMWLDGKNRTIGYKKHKCLRFFRKLGFFKMK